MSIVNLEPKIVWEIFNEITQIPRPSKREERMIAFIELFAQRYNLKYKKDNVGNIVIYKSAIGSGKGKPTIILQSHMDMVCEKNSEVNFDFMNDAIQTYIDNGWVRAKGTTLGSDDGIGLAMELAILASDTIEHPNIEALFTIDEETGLTGAYNLSSNMLTGKYLINLDSEDEGEVFIGCAGGIDTIARFEYKKESLPKEYIWLRIDITGLQGGHSGSDINKGRANANKILTRLLIHGEREYRLRMSLFDGGNLRNAIPREAYAIIGIPEKNANKFEIYCLEFSSFINKEFTNRDIIKVDIKKCQKPEFIFDLKTQNNLLRSIQGVPNGVIEMNSDIPDLVETSSNLASVKREKNSIVVISSQRSSVSSAKSDIAGSVESIFLLAGADVSHSDGYPGWIPDTQSQLLDIAKSSYKKLFKIEPAVKAIHAGLECGLFLSKYPDLDMISIGPTIKAAHSPDEKLEIDSVNKFWLFLLELLKTFGNKEYPK